MVREFEPADQRAVRDLVLAGLGEHWGCIDTSLNPDLDDIASSYGHGTTVVAETNGVLVGTGTVVPRESAVAELVRVSVDISVRGHGVGRQVVDALLGIARGWQMDTVILETTADWNGVIAFWLRCGFRITHEAQGHFGRDIWFERPL